MTLRGRNASTTVRFYCCAQDPERSTLAGVDAKNKTLPRDAPHRELLAAVLKQRAG